MYRPSSCTSADWGSVDLLSAVGSMWMYSEHNTHSTDPRKRSCRTKLMLTLHDPSPKLLDAPKGEKKTKQRGRTPSLPCVAWRGVARQSKFPLTCGGQLLPVTSTQESIVWWPHTRGNISHGSMI
ncbi:hypothetical protein Taro_010213 [Colocasia esculenta]|uniref:Uncharacterized protein n=1 Tax=Colocasia esculenta TaxID=4460 RepID=A0A843U2Z5_COLES|nr:hypothetical protein [Colocasia esculenta]